MPLHPLSPAKAGNAAADNKIVPGKVVEYEQHSKPNLGAALAEKRGKWSVVNQQGNELDLPADRLTIIPGATVDPTAGKQQKLQALKALSEQADCFAAQLNLEEVWEVFLGEKKEIAVEDVAELAFRDAKGPHYLAARRALLNDQIYFKRRKSGFEPRPENIVTELKAKAAAEAEKERRRQAAVGALLARLKDGGAPLPPETAHLEQLAALGSSAVEAKLAKELLEEVAERGKLDLSGKLEDRAFQLLVALGRFLPEQDLTPIRLGRPLEFDEETIRQAQETAECDIRRDMDGRTDLRTLFCMTIDGAETRDFDDALSVEMLAGGGCRVGIHIADVSTFIPCGSLLEEAALRRGSSVYTPDYQVPMLPREISENTLSLIEDTERLAMSFMIEFDSAGSITSRTPLSSIIRVGKRFTYEEVDDLLCSEQEPGNPTNEALHKLWQISSAYQDRRMEAGALQFDRREMAARLLPDGTIRLEPANDDTPARRLVCELMILANESAALFARDNKIPIVFRSQEPPDENPSEANLEIPEGPAREYLMRGLLKRSSTSFDPAPHAGLGVQAYTQTTSPIRRAVDLITQRQLAQFIRSGRPCYSSDDITALIGRIEGGVEEAVLIQRERNRYWLLRYLIENNIKEIDGVIVRVDGLKPMAELDIVFMLCPFHPAPGSYVPNNRRNLGRRVRLKVENINPRTQTLLLREIA